MQKSKGWVSLVCGMSLVYLLMGILVSTVANGSILFLFIVFLVSVASWLAIFFKTNSFFSIAGVTVSFLFVIVAILKLFQVIAWDELLLMAPLWGLIQGLVMLGEGIFEKNRRMLSAKPELAFAVLLIVLALLLFILPPAGILTMVEITRMLVGLEFVFVGASVLCHLF